MVPPSFLHIRIEFILFGLTLLCVALFHHHTLRVALLGLLSIIIFKLVFDPTYHWEEHFLGTRPLVEQLFDKHLRGGEWAILLNLFGLLLGFAILAKHFETSGVPDYLPRYLPDDWKGGFVLLALIFVMSSFLDNIAAAMIGGTVALVVFKNKVHIGYLAAIVAASNAGGSGSVVGDTTTTMMWIAGVPATDVFPAYIAAVTAFLTFAFVASRVQDRYQRIQKDPVEGLTIDYVRLGIVGLILLLTIATNVLFDFPALGVWVAILLGSLIRQTPWHEIREALPGTLFLLALVTCASLMPINELPPASWQSAFVLGFVSSVFDNIPLTKLALDQGGYDWAILAYAVGFGGSMIWFGSSAGVAISNIFPEARSVSRWFTKGWFVAVAYVVGFLAILVLKGWHP
ncbi:SLC13 family permease [Telluribacter humicola]|uniref:SLC13 family permease n=1 Tax=Telluribacter humicola TaxID=1720261 RepID=UPI001A96F523|nr:SLC13 family permease [Telluribacter humicola]